MRILCPNIRREQQQQQQQRNAKHNSNSDSGNSNNDINNDNNNNDIDNRYASKDPNSLAESTHPRRGAAQVSSVQITLNPQLSPLQSSLDQPRPA